MSDFERQVHAEQTRAQQLGAAGEELERKRLQTYRDFVTMMLSHNVTPSPYFKMTQTSRERLALGKFLHGQRSYNITRDYSFLGQCWLFAISDFSSHYAVTTDARPIKVTFHTPDEPSRNLRNNFDAEAVKAYSPRLSLLIGGEESGGYDSYLVKAARSLIDGNGPIRLHDSN